MDTCDDKVENRGGTRQYRRERQLTAAETQTFPAPKIFCLTAFHPSGMKCKSLSIEAPVYYFPLTDSDSREFQDGYV